MKRALLSPFLLLLSVGCASGGGTSSSPQRIVLVEVRGSAPEAEAFAARLLYEAGERGTSIVDGRLSGGHLSDLTDPSSEASRKLREAFPGDLYLGAEVGPCETIRRTATMPGSVDPMTGVRTTDVIGGVDVVCSATVSELGGDGKAKKSASADGRMAVTGAAGGTEPSLEAARDAATQTAKKLFGKVR